MPFEVFTNQRIRAATEPTVTITTRGILSLNDAAWNALDQPEAVELLFDRETRTMGLRKSGPENPTSYPVRCNALGKAFQVSAKAFTSHYDIPTYTAVRRKARMDFGDLCVDVTDPGVAVTSNRKGR